MPKCKWCGENSAVDKYGYCGLCYDEIRSDILKNKDRLDQLDNESKSDLAADVKIKICNESILCCNNLKIYKKRQVPFFKSDYLLVEQSICEKLGFLMQQEETSIGTVKSSSALKLVQFVANFVIIPISLFIAFYTFSLNTKYSSALQETSSIVSIQATEIQSLQSQLEKAKNDAIPASTKKQSFTLKNGHYIAGSDFPAGTYNLWALKGNGNVYSDNVFSGGINAIMGIDTDNYEREYKNISLPDGTTLSISDVEIKMTLVN